VTVAELLAVATEAGLTVAVVHGQLLVKGPKRAADVGRAVLARKAEVFAHLTPPPPVWSVAEALRRMAADAAVERHGCRGADPLIQAAAACACEAYRQRDADGVARACAEVARLAASIDGAIQAPGSEERGLG